MRMPRFISRWKYTITATVLITLVAAWLFLTGRWMVLVIPAAAAVISAVRGHIRRNR